MARAAPSSVVTTALYVMRRVAGSMAACTPETVATPSTRSICSVTIACARPTVVLPVEYLAAVRDAVVHREVPLAEAEPQPFDDALPDVLGAGGDGEVASGIEADVLACGLVGREGAQTCVPWRRFYRRPAASENVCQKVLTSDPAFVSMCMTGRHGAGSLGMEPQHGIRYLQGRRLLADALRGGETSRPIVRVELKTVEYGDEAPAQIGERIEAKTRSGKRLTGTVVALGTFGDPIISQIIDWTTPPDEAARILARRRCGMTNDMQAYRDLMAQGTARQPRNLQGPARSRRRTRQDDRRRPRALNCPHGRLHRQAALRRDYQVPRGARLRCG